MGCNGLSAPKLSGVKCFRCKSVGGVKPSGEIIGVKGLSVRGGGGGG